jgi:hypothetical protein
MHLSLSIHELFLVEYLLCHCMTHFAIYALFVHFSISSLQIFDYLHTRYNISVTRVWFMIMGCITHARGSVVGWGTMLQTGRSPVQVLDKVDFFNPSNRTMTLGSTQPLTEMSTRNLPGGWKAASA